MTGVQLIAAERERQVSHEGWTPEHDDAHENGELIAAAVRYADAAAPCDLGGRLPDWPWEPVWFKPTDDPIRNLVKAGALLAAEIDRLQRLGGPQEAANTKTPSAPSIHIAPVTVDNSAQSLETLNISSVPERARWGEFATFCEVCVTRTHCHAAGQCLAETTPAALLGGSPAADQKEKP